MIIIKKNLAAPMTSELMQVSLNTISIKDCDKKYTKIPFRSTKISQGIVDESMVCAIHEIDGNAFCSVSFLLLLYKK